MLSVFPGLLSTFISWDKVYCWAWSSLIWLDWLANEFQGSACLYPYNMEVTGDHWHIWFSWGLNSDSHTWVVGTLIHWAVSPALSVVFLIEWCNTFYSYYMHFTTWGSWFVSLLHVFIKAQKCIGHQGRFTDMSGSSQVIIWEDAMLESCCAFYTIKKLTRQWAFEFITATQNILPN